MTVEMRCAMQSTVCCANSLRIVCWMRLSVSTSTAEVASSSKRILFDRRRARAKHICCRWPNEKFSPFSATVAANLSATVTSLKAASPQLCRAKASTCDCKWERQMACQTASPVDSFSGSKLKRRSPENRTGSCGSTVMLRRTLCKPKVAMSNPSINILPSVGSTMRSSTFNNEDLPAPVRPQMPNFSPGTTFKPKPSKTKGSSGRYFRRTSLNSTPPSMGQVPSAGSVGRRRGGSGLSLMYSSRRSTETMLDSRSEVMRTTQFRACVTLSAYEIETPAIPALMLFRARTANKPATVTMTLPIVSRRTASQRFDATFK
mmetsp:Transcript_84749/g.220797  ORF Transcript_84749/g.220797 Transcript_84749/m.220797 type:complete len:318 (+) Transcript_84749:244-1197(+)